MTAAVRAPSGRTIWKAVRDELMLNLYPMPFSTIAPAIYHVYLHPDDFAAIEGVSARVVGQIEQALTTEVERVNQGLARSTRRVLTRLLDREELQPIELPAGGWEVHLCADRNDELERGQLGIVSTLAMSAPAEYAGTPTTRIVRAVVGRDRRSTIVSEGPPAAPPAPVTAAGSRGVDPKDTRERARLTYEDEQGPHVFLMRKDVVSIGRGGSSAWVDVQVVASARVSREHLRLRLDASGQFFIQDVSLWGTQVNGEPIPPALKSTEGVAQPGLEQPLPPKARIGLAETIVIEFEALTGP